MPNERLPYVDLELVTWSRNLADKLLVEGQSLGISEQTALNYSAAQVAFTQAFQRVADPSTRTKVAVSEKDVQKRFLLGITRRVVAVIRAQPDLDPGQLISLGLHVSERRSTPLPPPAETVRLEVETYRGHSMDVRLSAAGSLRGRPKDAAGALLFAYWDGPTPPKDISDWRFVGSTSKTRVTVDFPNTLPPGTIVHLAGFWCNSRFERGPGGDALRTMITLGSPRLGGALKAA